ncbi:MAG TPA: DUF1559 domain-containing protein [Fimbriiglobus sp.]|jgi:hypothetical protein
MSRRFGLLLAIVALFLGCGVALTLIVRNRYDQSRAYTLNNLRELNHFAVGFIPPDKSWNLAPVERSAIPAGTVVRPDLLPDERLSWVVEALPYLNQKRQPLDQLSSAINRLLPWTAETNQTAARTEMQCLIPPAAKYESTGGPAPTYYLGITGRGVDAAALNLGPPVPTRAGCFRYNGDTPFEAVKDGLSHTLLFGETATDLGPWLRGGPSTLRGIDDSPGAKPVLGTTGQFGGVHVGVTAFSFADGSAKFFTDNTDPRILAALATIAGGADDPNLID